MFAVTLSASDNIARHTRTRNPMSPLSCSTSQQTSALRGAARSCLTMAGVRQVIGKDPSMGTKNHIGMSWDGFFTRVLPSTVSPIPTTFLISRGWQAVCALSFASLLSCPFWLVSQVPCYLGVSFHDPCVCTVLQGTSQNINATCKASM